MICPQGSTEWKNLSTFSEFQDDLRTTPGIGGPTPPARLPSRPPPKTSGLAVASLALGILSLCTGITAPVGLVLGFKALSRIKKSEAELAGRGLAIAGISMSAAVLSLLLLTLLLALPALASSKAKAQSVQCLNNLKQLGLAVRIYASDHDDKLPGAATWSDEILPSAGSPEVFRCPASKGHERCSYAFNSRLSGLNVDKVSPSTVLLFERTGDWNQSGGAKDILSHHGKNYVLCFADGSVRQVPAGQVSKLRWQP